MNKPSLPAEFLKPDYQQAARFLQILNPATNAQFTFQTYDDDKERKSPGLAFVRTGTFDENRSELRSLNLRRASVCVTVNETDGKGRKAENIKTVRAIWQDDDANAGPPGDGFPPPHIVTETSPGKHQRIWIVKDFSAADAKAMMNILVTRFGSDPNAKDISRVLRLPGFYHQKGEPHKVQLVSTSEHPPLTPRDLAKWLSQPLSQPSAPPSASRPGMDFDVRKVMAALSVIPADDRSVWLSVGMALHAATSGGDNGFLLWESWSRSSDKFDAGDQERVWRSFKADGKTTLGTLFHIAREYGFRDSAEDFRGMAVLDPLPSGEIGSRLQDRIIKPSLTLESIKDVPARPWLVPNRLIRGKVTSLVAPGSVGKSLLTLQWAAALALGKGEFTDLAVCEGIRSRVLYVNLEDDPHEIRIRLAAMALKFGLPLEQLDDWLDIYDSSDNGLCVLKRKDRILEPTPDYDELFRLACERGYDAVIVDPLVEAHEADENSNPEMRLVLAAFRQLAKTANCSVLLVHHTRKPAGSSSAGHAGNADSGRGASAFVNGVRVGLTLFAMSEGDAKRLRVPQAQRHLYVRLDDAKTNLSLASPEARWFKKVTIPLPSNEKVGVLEPVELGRKTKLTPEQIEAVRKRLEQATANGEWKKLSANHQAPTSYAPRVWAGSDGGFEWMTKEDIEASLAQLEADGFAEVIQHGRANKKGEIPRRWRSRDAVRT